MSKDDKEADATGPDPDYEAIAELSDPVLVVQKLIHHDLKEPKPEVEAFPELQVKSHHIWGPLPKEPPPKPERIAATLRTHVWKPDRPQKEPPRIGSMSPHLGKK